MIKMILFDLDGTLLPMDLDIYLKAYFGGIAKKAAPNDTILQKKVIDGIMVGTGFMMKNNGETTNEEAFWTGFHKATENIFAGRESIFDDFYKNEFLTIRDGCGYNPRMSELIALVKQLGFRTALATNPVFPLVATQNRISWAGLKEGDFELVTSFETSHYCKPNPNYYVEVAEWLSVSPEECLMVGNDTTDDRAAEDIGMQVFLLTDCLINKKGIDVSKYPSGNLDKFIDYIKEIKR